LLRVGPCGDWSILGGIMKLKRKKNGAFKTERAQRKRAESEPVEGKNIKQLAGVKKPI